MATPAKSHDVVVAGAGPAGAFAALLLARAGRRVLLADKADFPREKVCGCCVNGCAVARLESQGIALAGCDDSVSISEIEIRHRQQVMAKSAAGGVVIPRGSLDQLIVEKAVASGVEFIPRARVAVVSREASAITVSCGERTFAADILVEATGLAGRVDETRGAEVTNANSHLGAAATFRGTLFDVPPGRIAMHVGRGGYVGMVRFAGGDLHAAAALSPALVKENGSIGKAAEGILRSCGLKPYHAMDAVEWKGTTFLTRQRIDFSTPRQFTIGDAAGYWEPFTGEGIAWALESAAELIPFALQPWSEAIGRRWNAVARDSLRRRQRTARHVAWFLRRPHIVGAILHGDQFLSPIYSRIVHRMTAPPAGEHVS